MVFEFTWHDIYLDDSIFVKSDHLILDQVTMVSMSNSNTIVEKSSALSKNGAEFSVTWVSAGP